MMGIFWCACTIWPSSSRIFGSNNFAKYIKHNIDVRLLVLVIGCLMLKSRKCKTFSQIFFENNCRLDCIIYFCAPDHHTYLRFFLKQETISLQQKDQLHIMTIVLERDVLHAHIIRGPNTFAHVVYTKVKGANILHSDHTYLCSHSSNIHKRQSQNICSNCNV